MTNVSKQDNDIKWKIGELLLEGMEHWGEDDTYYGPTQVDPGVYTYAEEITGFSRKHLKDIASTARRCSPSVRTDALSWSHHRVLINELPEATEEELKDWLNKASEGNWAVAGLQKQIRGKKKPVPGDDTKSFLVTVPKDVFDIMKDYADEEQVTVPLLAAEWLSTAAADADGPQWELKKKWTIERRREKRRKVGRRVARAYNRLGLEQ